MVDCTDSRFWSVTSRQVKDRGRSWRVRGFDEEEEEEEDSVKFLRIWRMTESGFSLFLNGRAASSEVSVRRRFFLSAIDGGAVREVGEWRDRREKDLSSDSGLWGWNLAFVGSKIIYTENKRANYILNLNFATYLSLVPKFFLSNKTDTMEIGNKSKMTFAVIFLSNFFGLKV